MEPKPSAPQHGLEHSPVTYPRSIEYRAPEHGGERKPEQGVERRPEVGEAATVQPILPPPVVAPQPPTPVQDDQIPAEINDVPLVASDDDLIEKEWVDKAKKIVITTKDDPYKREAEVGKLQVEYLRKRYGKELGASE